MIAIFALLALLGAVVGGQYLPAYPPLRHNGELVANVKGGRTYGPFLDVFRGRHRRYLPPGYYGWPYGYLPPDVVSNPFYVQRRHRRRHHDSDSRSRSDSRDRDYDRRGRRRRDSSDSRDW